MNPFAGPETDAAVFFVSSQLLIRVGARADDDKSRAAAGNCSSSGDDDSSSLTANGRDMRRIAARSDDTCLGAVMSSGSQVQA